MTSLFDKPREMVSKNGFSIEILILELVVQGTF